MEIEPGGRYVLFVPTSEGVPFDALLRSGDAFREHLESQGAEEVTIFHMPPGSPVALLRLLSREDVDRRDGVEPDLEAVPHVLHGPTENARDRWQHGRPERP